MYDALDETSTTISHARVDAQIQTAVLWVLQAHDWAFLNVTSEDRSAASLVNTNFRRINQVYDTETNFSISSASTERALELFNDVPARNPQVFTVNQYGTDNTGGVGLRFWPEPEDQEQARFTVTGTLMPAAWPTPTTLDTESPSQTVGSISVALPELLHSVIAYKVTATLARQEQIMDLAQFYSEEAFLGLREAKNALIPAISNRLIVGSDYYRDRWVRGRGRRPWR